MRQRKSMCIEEKPSSITRLRRSPRFIHPNQPSDSDTPNPDLEKFKQEDCSKECDRGKLQNSVSKIDRQGSNGCIRSDAGGKSRSRKCQKKVSERSEADDLVAVSMVKELTKALNTPKNCSDNSGKRVTRSATRATAHKDNLIQVDVGEVYPDTVIGITADPIKSLDSKEVANQVDKKHAGSKRKFTSAIDVRPSVQERTTGIELKSINTAEKQPILQGWTKEQELALRGAYFSAKLTPHYWKKVAKMVPGKSTQECYEKIHSDILTPPQPQRRSVSKRTSLLSISLSPSILLTPSEPTSKKPKRGKGKQCSYKNVRQLLNKQAKTEQKSGKDLFSVLEPSYGLSTQSVQNTEVVSKGERSSPARRNDQSRHSDRLKGSLNSPPVLKKIKNRALHEKYIDQLHMREAKRNVASKRATQCGKGKNDAKESQVLEENVIGKAKSSLIDNARSAINEFLQLQSNFTVNSDDGNDDVDDIDEDEMENSL